MTNRTAWTAGNGVGYTWSTLVNSADLASMANGSSVLSSVADIANQTNQDIYMDISQRLIIASSTIVAGANIAYYLYALLDDGSTYGDGSLVAGTQSTNVPPMPPCATISARAAVTQTLLNGFAQGIIIPPGSFRVVAQNNSGFALTAGTQIIKYRTYNLNLNN